MPDLIRRRRCWFRVRLIASVLLGPVTTFGLAWASAAWLPVENGTGVIALDGDHLQPWLIRLERPSATRVLWFEKGRIWGQSYVGRRSPGRVFPDGLSAAVNCWSFAMSARGNPGIARGPADLPDSIAQLVSNVEPPSCWGAAQDERGWPLPALRAHIIGSLNPGASSHWVCDDGILLAVQPGRPDSLATVRALPLAPVWGGVIIDSVLYSGLWWLALTGLAWTLGFLRSHLLRGRCPRCRYDLRGDLPSGCPECGWNRVSE